MNKNIRQELISKSLSIDTTSFINHLLEYDVTSLEEYVKKSNESNAGYNDDIKSYQGCSFDIVYQTSELISIYITGSMEEPRSKGMYWGFILNYDLLTGKKLEFEDVLSIGHDELLDAMYQSGYQFWIDNSIAANQHFDTLRRPDDYLEYHIGDLMELDINEHMRGKTLDDACISFSFKEIEGQLHFRFLLHCLGPASIEYGIPLKELSEYIIHPNLRNELNLWGQSIYDLIGMKYTHLGREIRFSDQKIVNGGGGMLSQDPANPDQSHGISFLHSDSKFYRLFVQLKPEKIILDVLEIAKEELQDSFIIEALCSDENGTYDTELMAIVRKPINEPDKFLDIQKAWRANRKTGKFEVVDISKVNHCYNEGYGARHQ